MEDAPQRDGVAFEETAERVKVRSNRSEKPTKAQIARARAYIDSMEWKFSRTMPQWPHRYVVREWGRAREFDFIERLINRFGYKDPWGTRNNWYLKIGRLKYWIDEDVLNRAQPISNAEVRRHGLTWLARHRMKVGPYGRPIAIKRKRRKRR